MATRTPIVVGLEQAASLIEEGDTVGVGGFITSNKPLALLRAVMKARKGGLTVCAPPSSIEVDLLIALGLVERTITPYVGIEAIAPIAPFFGRWAGRSFRVDEVDVGSVIAMLRARIQRIPFLPTRVVGTSIPELSDYVSVIDDPFGGPPLAAVRPVHLDVAVIHAAQSDPYGNVQHLGACFADHLLAQAADTVIVQVERIVANEVIRKAPTETTLPAEFVDAVVEAPYGAHPVASQSYYRLDAAHLRNYVSAAKSFLDGDEEPFNRYVAQFIDGPADHGEYCDTVGAGALFSLGMESGHEPGHEPGEV